MTIAVSRPLRARVQCHAAPAGFRHGIKAGVLVGLLVCMGTAAASTATLRLRAESSIEGSSPAVSVNQVLVTPLAGEWATCAENIQTLDPRVTSLGRLWVEARLRPCGARRWRWSGPLSIHLTRPLPSLHATPGEAIAAALAADAAPGHPVATLDDSTIATLPPPEPGLTYLASLPPRQSASVPKQPLLRLDAYRDGQRVRSSVWSARIQHMAEVWVAKRAVRAGELLVAEDFERRTMDVAGWPAPVDAVEPWPSGWRSRGGTPAGAPLLRARMAEVPEVRVGEPVSASAAAGRVVLTMGATALQDGKPGSWVRVRFPRQRDTAVARVVGDGQVEMK